MPCGYCGLCPASLVAIDGFWQRTAEHRASSAARRRAHGAKLSKCRTPSVAAGNNGRRHRSWRLMAFGNERRSAVQAAPQGAVRMGLELSKCRLPSVVVGYFSCLAGLVLALQCWHWQQHMAARRVLGLLLACIGEATVRAAREWCSCLLYTSPSPRD